MNKGKHDQNNVKIQAHKNRGESCNATKLVKRKSVPSLNHIKLSVAMELRSEGFDAIVFDKVFDFRGQRVKVHVFGEDGLGLRIAVVCVNRASSSELYAAADAIELIRYNVEGCGVALAFPLQLLPKISNLIGLTSRAFLVDEEGRAWVHSSSTVGAMEAWPERVCGLDSDEAKLETSVRNAAAHHLPYLV